MSDSAKKVEQYERVIAALLAAPTHEAAATAAGISSATLRRLLVCKSFQAAYRAARRQLVDTAIARLQAIAGEAVEALKRNLTCGKPVAEIRAALGVLEHVYKGQELLDLAERLELVEATLKGGE